ncbi:uncharacterized protein THITE_2116755 [Thermothielavioides terrestris NRRL 8126]|uniref:Uncharacterized protein n=1 Tax=Thermothielavioides terrestris (strain ATCC 38088 / NRRL 8126) TaxID=578455 RepID=G2R723_THETT|nr:uncharacterized protein THITE_2116755 [Thermothielavioides terrestris NRRL 8126]AEO67751.1 hypothetical protein THITE_2116755 [Thermothielavioides terrestris NRRL 8126]
MDEEGKLVRSLRSEVLELPPSCVEFCPAFPSYFLVGTYDLQRQTGEQEIADADADASSEDEAGRPAQLKQPQSRNGSIIAFRLCDGDITRIQTVPQPSALLDLRFNPHSGNGDICAAVSSTATLALFRLSPEEEQPLKHLNTMDIAGMSQGEIKPSAGQEILFLSFSWHPLRANVLALTTSTGNVHLVHLRLFDGNWALNPEPILTHTLETWCVAISPVLVASEPLNERQEACRSPFRVYSGGDDSMLRFKTCSWNEGAMVESVSGLASRGHDAGVTAILPLALQEDGNELVVTGSYDEHIRLFEVPSSGKPKSLAEHRLGGGVWRLKLIDLNTTANQSYIWRARMLASCMHAGVRVVELLKTMSGGYRFRVLGRFEEHQSMNYGSDFQPGWMEKLSVVSTSFYDKLLCLWEFEMV